MLVNCKICGKVVKNPRPRQKVCSYRTSKRLSPCQIAVSRMRSAARNRRIQRVKDRAVKMTKPVICDQCGYEIKRPYKAQMTCTLKNGRPVEGSHNGKLSPCQMKRMKKKVAAQAKDCQGLFHSDGNGNEQLMERECLGVLCTEEGEGRKFMSAGPFNRICPRCEASELNHGGRQVRLAGVEKCV